MILFATVVLFSLSATTAFALNEGPDLRRKDNSISTIDENTLSELEVNELTIRIDEIRNMDKSNLTKQEKSELRKEVKEMKKSLRKASNGIYIGAGTLLVALLVVLLLV